MSIKYINSHNVGSADFDAVTIEKTITVADDATFDGGTLFIDASENKVGINTTSPTEELEIDGDLKFSPTAITTAHVSSTGSLDIRCANNLKMGTDGADSVRIGRDNATTVKVHIRSGDDSDLVVSNRKVGIGTETPTTKLQVTESSSSWAANIVNGSSGSGLEVNSGSSSSHSAFKVTNHDGTVEFLRVKGDGNTGIGLSSPKTKLTVEGALTLKEQSAADGDTAAYGQIWIKDSSPNELFYTTDAGNDIQLTSGTALAVTDLHSVGVDGSANQILTDDGDGTVTSESGLTYDGSNLAITGTATVSGGAVQLGNSQNGSFIIADTAHDAAGKSITLAAGNTTAGTTNNIAGGDLELRGGKGKGSGAGGDIVFQVASPGGSGSSLNSHATALTIADNKKATFEDDVIVSGEIELGHATDTSISRSSAGVIAVEGVVVPTVSSTSTLTNKTLTEPKFADGGFIADAAGLELLKFDSVSSAVNEITIKSAAADDWPEVQATGDDTNIPLGLKPKGNGQILVGTGSAAGVISSDGAQDLKLQTNEGTNSGYINIVDSSNGDIELVPNGTGLVSIGPSAATKLQFRDSGIFVQSDEDGHLLIESDGNITQSGFPSSINSLGTSATSLPGVFGHEADGTGRVIKYLNDTIVAGDIYYLADDPAWEKAQANDLNDGAPGDLLAIALGTNSNTHGLLLEGLIRLDSGSYTGTAAVGKVCYLCETTAGNLNFDAPTGSGEVVRTVGHCLQKDGSNNILVYFKPSNDYVELA